MEVGPIYWPSMIKTRRQGRRSWDVILVYDYIILDWWPMQVFKKRQKMLLILIQSIQQYITN